MPAPSKLTKSRKWTNNMHIISTLKASGIIHGMAVIIYLVMNQLLSLPPSLSSSFSSADN